MPAATVSASNVIADPTKTLQRFDLLDLEQYTQEKSYATNASKDFHLFYVGRDDVHEILKHILSRVSVSLYMNMFGFDDEELNDILMQLANDPSVVMMITLDKSQAGGVHEKRLLDSDAAKNPHAFNTYFVIGESATHQISHTKGFVADGKLGGEQGGGGAERQVQTFHRGFLSGGWQPPGGGVCRPGAGVRGCRR